MSNTDTTAKKVPKLFDHKSALEIIPHEPGCYLMKDKQGRIIYIGKAKDLKNRVRNYFQKSGDSRAFVKMLPHVLHEIETIITRNEKEALILENTLIKRHKPRYNVLLKDDKYYASLRIDTKADWPRVEVVRRKANDNAKYFGPYSSGGAMRQTLNVLNRHFQLRTCSDSVLNNRTRPCLQYQIKRCPGPCVLDVDEALYSQHVKDAILFLEGKGTELVEKLTSKMLVASDELEFELAAHYRDQIESISKVLETQKVVTTEEIDRDAFGFYREGEHVVVQLMTVRRGRLEGAKSFPLQDQAFPDVEILSSFLSVYYQSGRLIPDEVLLPMELDEGEHEAFTELLTELKESKVKLLVPKRGTKKALVDTAHVNAEQAFKTKHDEDERIEDMMEKLQQKLSLTNMPNHIECYDISNFQGDPIVGSQVVFKDTKPSKKDYRRFKMKEVTSQNDFASMHELLTRRLTKVANGEDDAPDLIVVDGGKGQLGQAVAVLDDLGLSSVIDVVSLAKSRVDKVGFQDADVTRSPERVFIPGRKNPIVLKQNSSELYLLQRVRDEAHRVAITFHKQLRSKQAMRSSLDDVPGVGKHTRKLLLKHFGSLKKIKAANIDEIKQVTGIGEKTAKAIFAYFHPTTTTIQEESP